MVNTSSCTVEVRMHLVSLVDVLGLLLSSQELVTSVLSGNKKHARVIESDQTNILAML